MADYAKDLLAKNREALIARYHTNGVWMLGPGADFTKSRKEIEDLYRNVWRGPDEFSWHSLRYRLLSYDVILVEGGFFWKDSTTFTNGARSSYTSVLVKDRGEFKIRMELEFPEDLNPKIEARAAAESQPAR